MSSYDLLEHFKDIHDSKQNTNHESLYGKESDPYHKAIFRDKKLNKLWDKAEKSGFTEEELKALREEFQHHQEKLDTYQSIIKDESGPNDTHENSIDINLEKFNEIEEIPNKNKINEKANLLREKHLDIRDGYDKLQRKAGKGPKSKEFIEPKVQGLWKIALESNFSSEELESIKVELLHYENRLLKLRDLHAEIAFREHNKSNAPKENAILQDNVKKISRKIEKIHLTLESKIMMKHGEL